MQISAIFAALLLGISVCVANGADEPEAPTQPAPQDAIAVGAIEFFAKAEAAVVPDGYTKSANASQLAWGESYVLMAYLSMYEATGDRAYLQRFLEHADRVLVRRDDRTGVGDELRGRVMPAWSTTKYTKDKRYAWIAHTGMITYPMARWVYLAKTDDVLGGQYPEQIRRYEQDIVETVSAFDDCWRDGPGDGEGYYHSVYLGKALPLNMQNAFGRTLVALWLATGDETYRRRAEKLARYFKNRITKDGDRYVWAYWPADSTRIEDVSHAAINVDFAFVCYRAGIVFDKADMEAFVQTFKGICRGAEGFAGRIDGTGEPKYSASVARWLHLAFIAPELRKAYWEYLQATVGTKPVAEMVGSAYLAETARGYRPDNPVDPTELQGQAD